MAYQTGTATSPVNFLQQLVTWLVAQGWTQNMSQADGTGSVGWRAHLSKGGNFINLRAATNENLAVGGAGGTAYGLACYLSTAWNSANSWSAQVGGPANGFCAMNLPQGNSQNYYFFTDALDNVIVVVETTPSVYGYVGWGLSITKAGAFTGGQYFYGSINIRELGTAGSASPGSTNGPSALCPGFNLDFASVFTMFLRADVDTFINNWVAMGFNTFAPSGYNGKNGYSSVVGLSSSQPTDIIRYQDASFQLNQVSQLNSQANLLPVLLWVARDGGGSSLVGVIPNVFLTNGVNAGGFSKASIYALGAQNYMMFPNFAVVKQ